jgi:rhamnosyl/mannosyltransferase
MLWHARRLRNVDVVHLHMPFPPGDLVSLAVAGRPPLVVTYHSDIVRQQTLLRLYGPLLRHTLARAARILVTSRAYAESSPWLRRHLDRCTVVPSSIDPARFAQPGSTAPDTIRQRYRARAGDSELVPLILFVGRLRYYKGLHFLLEALPLLRTPAHLLLVGTGPEEPRLRELVKTMGLHARVHFLGEVSDAELPSFYHAAQVLVLPSHLRAEAYGLVQLEAQAAGLPIVCTELGTGTTSITQHGVTGFAVPPADPPALARALDALLANPALAQRMGVAGTARVWQEFSHPRMVARTMQVYREVLGVEYWSPPELR